MVKKSFLGQFWHRRRLNDDSLNWLGFVVCSFAVICKLRSKSKVTTRPHIVCLCVSVCLSCSCCNFWKPWPRNFIFSFTVSRSNSHIKIMGSRSSSLDQKCQTSISEVSELQVVHLQLKDIFVINCVIKVVRLVFLVDHITEFNLIR